jgi:hypothetical protein
LHEKAAPAKIEAAMAQKAAHLAEMDTQRPMADANELQKARAIAADAHRKAIEIELEYDRMRREIRARENSLERLRGADGGSSGDGASRLRDENDQLRSQVAALSSRLADLEKKKTR